MSSKINKEEWEKEMWRCSDIAEVCRANLANHDYKLLTKTILNFIKVARQEAIKEFLGSDEREVYQDYKTLQKMARQDFKKEIIEEVREEIEKLKIEQIKLYGGKLPFVVFGGKADENEKITIYRQALSDLQSNLKII